MIERRPAILRAFATPHSNRQLHAFPTPLVRQLCWALRRMVGHDPDAPVTLELGTDAARQVQLAVYADKLCRRRISAALAHARLQALQYLESESG